MQFTAEQKQHIDELIERRLIADRRRFARTVQALRGQYERELTELRAPLDQRGPGTSALIVVTPFAAVVAIQTD